MILILVPRLPPLPPSPIIKLDRRHTGRLRKRDDLLTGEGVGGVQGPKSHYLRESLVRHKSFNTLCTVYCIKNLKLFIICRGAGMCALWFGLATSHARPVVWFGRRACAHCGLVWPQVMRVLWFGLAGGHVLVTRQTCRGAF